MMTGFGIILPVFARRLPELGSGFEALGLMATAFALAQFVAAPFMGSLADRLGRRPIVLGSLAALAFLAAVVMVPETRTAAVRRRGRLHKLRETGLFAAAGESVS